MDARATRLQWEVSHVGGVPKCAQIAWIAPRVKMLKPRPYSTLAAIIANQRIQPTAKAVCTESTFLVKA